MEKFLLTKEELQQREKQIEDTLIKVITEKSLLQEQKNAVANITNTHEKSNEKFRLTEYMKALTEKDKSKSLDLMKKKYDETGDKNYETAVKQLQATDLAAGGYLIPEQFINDLITQVYASAPLLDILTRVDISSGSARIPKETLKPTFFDVGENEAITETQTAYGDINFEAKETAGILAVSNKLIRRSTMNTEQMLINSLTQGIAEHVQKRILHGAGSSNQVLGLYSQVASGNKFTTAGVTLDNITTDLMKAITKIEDANHNLQNAVWVMPARHYWKARTIRNSLGIAEFADELRNDNLYGFPVAKTNANVNTSEVWLIDLNSVLMGIAKDLEIIIEPYANYTDAAGNQVNGFQKDITGIRISMEYDVKTKYNTGLSIIESVAWGA